MHPSSEALESAPQPLSREQQDAWPGFLRAFGRIGVESFGGPVAQIGVMHREAVERRGWVTDGQFAHLLSFANVLPGPEALELAIHLGYLRRGVAGGVVAGLLFVLPGFFALTLLAWAYLAFGQLWWVDGVLDGMRPVALALIAAAAMRLAGRALKGSLAWALCALSIALNGLVAAPFLLVLAGCGVAGIALAGRPRLTQPLSAAARALAIAVVVPLVVACALVARHEEPAIQGDSQIVELHPSSAPERLARVGWVNTKAALITFGGAYTVLPYLREQYVRREAWVGDAQMIDALALGETTPGPLISVGVFLAFLAGGPWGALVGAFFLFLPSFLFVLLLGRHAHRVESLPRSREALHGVSAGTLGLMLAMSSTLVAPTLQTPFSWVVALAAFAVSWRLRWSVVLVVALGAAAGLARALVIG